MGGVNECAVNETAACRCPWGLTPASDPLDGTRVKGEGWSIHSLNEKNFLRIEKFANRSSSKKSEGRGPVKGSGSGVKQSHTTLESEKEAALMTVSKFTNQTQQTHPPLAHPPPSRDAPAQAILKPTPSTKDKLDEATVQRKTISIIEEFVTNSDLKVGVVPLYIHISCDRKLYRKLWSI